MNIQGDYSNYILLFGGAFDPPHKGHLACIKLALEFNFYKIFLIPSGDNRKDRKHFASGNLRAEMLRIMLKESLPEEDRVLIDDIQITNPKFKNSYAIDLAKYYQQKFPENKIGFLIGSDNADKLSTWKDYSLLKEFVSFFIAGRSGYEKGSINLNSDNYTPLDISSSKIRKEIKETDIVRDQEGVQKVRIDSQQTAIGSLKPHQIVYPPKPWRRLADGGRLKADSDSENSLSDKFQMTPGVLNFIRKHRLFTALPLIPRHFRK